MKKFSIDVKASGKKEMKKVREYLRRQGYSVIPRRNDDYDEIDQNYLYSGRNVDFEYYRVINGIEILILPQDWDKLIEYTKKEEETMDHGVDSLRYAINQMKKPYIPNFPKGGVDIVGCGHGPEKIIYKSNPIVDCWIFRELQEAQLKRDLEQAEKELHKAKLEEAKRLIKEAQELGKQFQKDLLEADKRHAIQLTKPELHKVIMYLTAARRKSCSVLNNNILNSVLNKLKRSRCQ